MIFLVLFIACLGFLSPANRGALGEFKKRRYEFFNIKHLNRNNGSNPVRVARHTGWLHIGPFVQNFWRRAMEVKCFADVFSHFWHRFLDVLHYESDPVGRGLIGSSAVYDDSGYLSSLSLFFLT